jgi:hypothetical protein
MNILIQFISTNLLKFMSMHLAIILVKLVVLIHPLVFTEIYGSFSFYTWAITSQSSTNTIAEIQSPKISSPTISHFPRRLLIIASFLSQYRLCNTESMGIAGQSNSLLETVCIPHTTHHIFRGDQVYICDKMVCFSLSPKQLVLT